MKELKLTGTTGGFPLFQNDLNFIQDASKEAVARIGEAFGGSNVVLYGLELVGLDVTAGAMLYAGETYTIPSIPQASITGKTLHIVTSYDNTLDPTTYKDLSSKNVHETRHLEWQTASGSPEDTTLTLANVELLKIPVLLSVALMKKNDLATALGGSSTLISLLSNNSEFINNSVYYGWSNLTVDPANWVISEQPKIRRVGTVGNYRVEFRGIIRRTGTAQTDTKIFTNISDAYYSPASIRKVNMLPNTTGFLNKKAEVYEVSPIGNLRNYPNTNGINENEYLVLDSSFYYI